MPGLSGKNDRRGLAEKLAEVKTLKALRILASKAGLLGMLVNGDQCAARPDCTRDMDRGRGLVFQGGFYPLALIRYDIILCLAHRLEVA
jgi:hypothetical protein